jgi:acetyltransferase-like isoleucine patch superfamily enzyme
VSGDVWLEHDWFPRPLPENVELGERSWLDSSYAFQHFHSHRPCAVRIGDESGVYIGTQFELGPHGEVQIGRFCTIVGAIFRTNGRVSIGDHTFVAHEVVMADAHAAVPPDGSLEPPAAAIEIGNTVWIGARAILLAGTRIGDGTVVGAGAVLSGEFPARVTVAGNPARVVGDCRACQGHRR